MEVALPPVNIQRCDEPAETLDEELSANGEEKVEMTKHFWRDSVTAMYKGCAAECYDAWLADEVVWHTTGMQPCISGKGKRGVGTFCKILQQKIMGSPHSVVTKRVDDVVYHPKTDMVKLDFTSSVLFAGATEPEVEFIRFCFQWDESMKIRSVVVSPPDEEPELQQVRPSVLSRPTADRPCLHNNWDPVRVKRLHSLLRCRACASQWKLHVTKVVRCPKYGAPGGCQQGSLCSALHVNTRKQTYEERTGMKQQSE
eukprot:TRINITY_DN1448_c0_g2_i1.p1 TRINITY_DN1448_c0_g2~~TRINITY_DN1448_c0_g2_i1.p1  ORF type:complete len:264 (+),score=43.24 TRINITY_DN1448_c0_g2_i1:25-792(+)